MKGTFEHFKWRTCYDCAHSRYLPRCKGEVVDQMYCDHEDMLLRNEEDKRGCVWWERHYDAWYKCHYCGHAKDLNVGYCPNCHRHQADAPIRIKEE